MFVVGSIVILVSTSLSLCFFQLHQLQQNVQNVYIRFYKLLQVFHGCGLSVISLTETQWAPGECKKLHGGWKQGFDQFPWMERAICHCVSVVKSIPMREDFQGSLFPKGTDHWKSEVFPRLKVIVKQQCHCKRHYCRYQIYHECIFII